MNIPHETIPFLKTSTISGLRLNFGRRGVKVTFCLAGQPGAETGAESVCPGRVIKQTACQPKQIFRFRGEASWKG